jgi:hypothetical protein
LPHCASALDGVFIDPIDLTEGEAAMTHTLTANARMRASFVRLSAAAMLAATLAAAGPVSAIAQGMGHGGMQHHGADGTGHDEVTMPGLRGLDATPRESAELAEMFRNFPDISREVVELPNGIRTVTFSEDEDLMAVIASHVVGMITRVEERRDPQIFIQSPTLDIFFERADRIETQIDMTDEGIVVIQTSDDPEVVAALHTHAGEVSAMADRGMAAVHEMMMQRAGN